MERYRETYFKPLAFGKMPAGCDNFTSFTVQNLGVMSDGKSLIIGDHVMGHSRMRPIAHFKNCSTRSSNYLTLILSLTISKEESILF